MSIWALKNSNTFLGISKAMVHALGRVSGEQRTSGSHLLLTLRLYESRNKACIRFVIYWLSTEGGSRQAHNLSTVCSLHWFQEFKEISIQSPVDY